MFIYEFMGGLVNTITGDEDDDTYDPHVHRKISKPTSYADTMIHLLKGSIGAGILAMPEAMSRVGVATGFFGIIAVGFVATYCIHLLISAQYTLCKRHKRGYMSYAKSLRVALKDGPNCLQMYSMCAGNFVDAVLVIWQLGLCCVYIVFVASNIKQVLDFYEVIFSLKMHILFLLLPVTIVNMVMDLKLLTPLSTISNFLTILGLLLVFFYLVEDDIEIDQDKIYKHSLEGIPVFIGTTLFALEAVGVVSLKFRTCNIVFWGSVLALEYNMEEPKQFVGLCGLFNIGMIIIVTLYTLVGVFGYLKYGDEIRASITLNLPENQKKAQVAKSLVALAIFLTYPLQNFVAYSIMIRKIKKWTGTNFNKLIDYLLRFILILIPWTCAWLVPTLGPFISLFGAFCLTLLALVFPALLDLLTHHRTGYGAGHYVLFRDLILAIVGMICLVAGCYTSILEILKEYE